MELWKNIVKTIQENYGYEKDLLQNTYRRGDMSIKNLPTLKEKKAYNEKLYQELDNNNQIDLSYFYQDEWAEIYREMSKKNGYKEYVDDESAIIEEHIDDFTDMIRDNTTLVDIGCGEWEKIIELAKKNESDTCEYIGTDISISNLFWLWNTKSNINNSFLWKMSCLVQNFDDLSVLREKKGKTIFVLGGSLGNIAKDKQLKFLQDIGNTLHTGEKCVFSTFLDTEDEQKMKASYENEEVKTRFMNWLKKLWFDTTTVGYEVEYKDNVVHIYAVCKQDQNNISLWEKKLSKKTGEKILLARSQRFSDKEIVDMIHKAWLYLEKSYKKWSSWMYVVSK